MWALQPGPRLSAVLRIHLLQPLLHACGMSAKLSFPQSPHPRLCSPFAGCRGGAQTHANQKFCTADMRSEYLTFATALALARHTSSVGAESLFSHAPLVLTKRRGNLGHEKVSTLTVLGPPLLWVQGSQPFCAQHQGIQGIGSTLSLYVRVMALPPLSHQQVRFVSLCLHKNMEKHEKAPYRYIC